MSVYDPDMMNAIGSAMARPFRYYFMTHPAEKGMTYGEHLVRAWSIGGRMGWASFCLFLHGLVPAWFPTRGSDTVKELYREMEEGEVVTKKEK